MVRAVLDRPRARPGARQPVRALRPGRLPHPAAWVVSAHRPPERGGRAAAGRPGRLGRRGDRAATGGARPRRRRGARRGCVRWRDPHAVHAADPEAVLSGELALLSPNHPDLDRWAGDPGVREAIAALRDGGWRTDSRQNRRRWRVVDTGLSVVAPEIDSPLAVVISHSVDARFGPTAALGISAEDPVAAAILRKLERSSGLSIRRRRRAPRHADRDALPGLRSADLAAGAVGRAGSRSSAATHAASSRFRTRAAPGAAPRRPRRRDRRLPARRLRRVCVPGVRPARAAGDRDARPAVRRRVAGAAARNPRRRPTESPFDHAELERWLPVARQILGEEDVDGVLDRRLVAALLHELGYLDFLDEPEPIAATLTHGVVREHPSIARRRLRHPIDPAGLVAQSGADALRFALLFAAGPARSFPWEQHSSASGARSWSARGRTRSRGSQRPPRFRPTRGSTSRTGSGGGSPRGAGRRSSGSR